MTTETNVMTTSTEVAAPAVVKALSKADKAREIFKAKYGQSGVARKDIIALLISEAGLTKAGAATYYQNMVAKRKEGKL